MMTAMYSLLRSFRERVNQKSFLSMITKDWERRVGIVVEDGQDHYCLSFAGAHLEVSSWNRSVLSVDMLICGKETDIRMLFDGDVLSYLYAKQQIETKGTVRDQLKLDAVLRLTVNQAG